MVVTKKKMSNTNADNVAKKFPRRDVLLPTKRKYMKESSTNVGNAVKNFLQREIFLCNCKCENCNSENNKQMDLIKHIKYYI